MAMKKQAKRQKTSKKSSKKKQWAAVVGKEYSKPELKCVDVNDDGGAPLIRVISTTDTLDLVNGIAVGANAYQRIGRSVKLHSMRFRGCILRTNSSGSTTGEFLRVLIVYDRQPNGAFPTYADIIQTIDSTGDGSAGPFDFPNLNNQERFLILREHCMQVPCSATAESSQSRAVNETIIDQHQQFMFDDYIKLDNLPSNYKDTGATISSVATGAIYVVTCGTEAVASAGCSLNYVTRLKYSDA